MRAAILEARRTMASVPGAAVTETRIRSLVSQSTSVVVASQVFQEVLFGLIGEEAQGQFAQCNEVVGRRSGEGLGTLAAG